MATCRQKDTRLPVYSPHAFQNITHGSLPPVCTCRSFCIAVRGARLFSVCRPSGQLVTGLLCPRSPWLHIILEPIDIFFANKIAAIEDARVFFKVLSHGYPPERLTTIHATFNSRYKGWLVLNLVD